MAIEYRLGNTLGERDRLLAQCHLFRKPAEALLSKLTLPDGARALEVGCGPLGILDLLSDKVCSSGVVVALDPDPRMIGWAATSAAERGLTNISLVHGVLPPPGHGEPDYDLVHCRLVLVNNANPSSVVTSMVDATRPGGWTALQEVDWASWQCDPPHPAWDRLKCLIAKVFGGDTHIGAKLPTLLKSAGVVNVNLAAHVLYWRPGDLYQTLLLHFAEIFRERILTSLSTTPEEFRSITNALQRHLHQPDTIVRESLLVQAWGRREA